MTERPGRLQNFVEWAYESLDNFATGIGGSEAARFVPIYASFFVLILGLQLERPHPARRQAGIPARPHQRRQRHPGSRALCLRLLRIPGLQEARDRVLSKFFPFYEFKNGVGAGLNRHVRRPDRAPPGVREAGHPDDATLRQHLRRRGRPRRDHGADGGYRSARDPGPGAHAQLCPGPDLQHSGRSCSRCWPSESHHEEGAAGHDAADAIEHAGAAAIPPPPDGGPTSALARAWPAQIGGSERHGAHRAGLAALGVIGPGIGIGILAGLSSAAIGRNPEAGAQIRGLAIILAAFAEGLGVLAVVVGLLAIFIKGA